MATIQVHKPPMTNVNVTLRDGEQWQQAAERAVRKMSGCKGATIATQNKLSKSAVQCMFVASPRGVGRVIGTYIVRFDIDA